MSLRPYPEYKASGVDWLDDIPAHWSITFLNHLAYIQPSNVDKHTKQGEIPVRLCNYTDVYKRTFIHNSIEFMQATATQSEIDKFTLKKGDVIITKDSEVWTDIAVPAYVTEELENVLCGYHLTHIRPYKGIVGKYIFRSFQALPIAYQFWVSAKGVTRYGIDTYSIKSSTFLLPPSDEQDAIVRFLDVAEKRIRRFIRAKQKLIKLLNEQKQAIIQQAVTKGINSNVQMKDSDVEWLGEIPEHWEVRRLKTFFRECDDRTKTGHEILFSLRMYEGLVPHNDVSTRPINPENLLGYKRVQPQQVVMNRMRAAIGLFGVMPKLGLVSPDYAIFDTTDEIVPEYYVELFKTSLMKGLFFVESKGLGTGSSGFMRLYTDRFGNIFAPKPPKSEQLDILAYINSATNEQSIAVAQTKQQIDLATEYRTRLIADVVTGKVDVRGLAFEMPEEFDDEDLLDVDEDELLEEDELEEISDVD